MRLNDLSGKRVVMWGGGIEGVATARAVAKTGAEVSIAIDDKTEGAANRIDNIKIYFAEKAVEKLLDAQVIIKTPGIPPSNPVLRRLVAANIPVVTATELWFADHASQTIGVTGTKGKSTTVSILSCLLASVGFDVVIGGNVGVPLLSLPAGKQWYIAELSSYQCASLEQSPYIAVFTSLFPEHLTWHGSLETYYGAKLNLAAHEPHAVVANGENEELRHRLPGIAGEGVHWVPGRRITVGETAITVDGQHFISEADMQLLGRHNLLNVALCLRVLMELDVDIIKHAEKLRRALQSFEPLEHRLELIGEELGIRWINDSLSTTPQSAIAALEIFKDNPSVTIILGGQDRGISYKPLQDYFRARRNPVNILTIPDSGDHIAEVIGDVAPHTILHCDTLREAVTNAAKLTKRGGVVLLSPAAPSFGKFKDYRDRGDQFTAAVDALKS